MLIRHPQIYLDASGDNTDALLVRDGRIRATGDKARHGANSDDETIRPDGTCLFPALGDAHTHLWGLDLRAGTVDLRGLDADAALMVLADADPGPRGWIFGANLDEHNFSAGTRVTRRQLDDLYPRTPVCIHRVDRHAVWVNTAALERTDFQSRYTPTGGGRVERDDQGKPAGRLVDDAVDTFFEAVPDPGPVEDRAAAIESANRLHDHGIGFCTVAYCPTSHLSVVRQLTDSDEFPLALDVLVEGTDDDFDAWLQEGPTDEEDLRIAGVKFFADGALGSQGARLLEPYRSGDRGLKMHSDGYLERRIPKLMQQGLQVAVHAIGDAATREVLDAFEAVPDSIRRRLRPRLEHAQMVAPDDIPRFAALDVIASIQPIHLRSDAPWADEHLNDEQLERLFNWRSLSATTLAAGSDYPIDDPNPWHGIATALTRRGSDGRPFRPEEALTRSEILEAYTRGAARASHREQDFGSLHPGRRAGVIALDTDPFEASPDEIWETAARFVETGY